MGRKGDLLRQAKKQKAIYTFTGEELEAHDREIFRKARESAYPAMKKFAKEFTDAAVKEKQADIDAYWKTQYDRFKEGGTMDTLTNAISYTLAISCRVLIEQFGWKPPNEGKAGRNTRIMQYAQALTNEITDNIGRQEGMDIVRYAEETKRLYGLEFKPEDEG